MIFSLKSGEKDDQRDIYIRFKEFLSTKNILYVFSSIIHDFFKSSRSQISGLTKYAFAILTHIISNIIALGSIHAKSIICLEEKS